MISLGAEVKMMIRLVDLVIIDLVMRKIFD